MPEVVAAKPGARYDAEWGNLFQNPSDFVALVYQGFENATSLEIKTATAELVDCA